MRVKRMGGRGICSMKNHKTGLSHMKVKMLKEN